MTAQLDLEFRAEAPEVTPSEVAELIARLRGHGWQTARDLGANKESDKRRLRAIAEASEGQIISGQKGYKLTLEATPADIESFAWLRRQAKKNMGRWIRTIRVWHDSAHSR
jgi:hypothetical protein